VADISYISQVVGEAAPGDATTEISQNVVEAGADDAATNISQAIIEAGADDAATFVSQAVLEAGADDAATYISQIVIEWSAGGLIPPPPPEPATSTFVFDEGEERVEYYLIPQISDAGVELRDKVLTGIVVTGLYENADVKAYVYGPTDEVVVSDLEDGLNSTTGAIALPDTAANVSRSPRLQVNCPNAMNSG
jgi:hypothetical protein